MRILIVEDETAAYENLADMLVTIDPTLEIMGNTESVQQTVRWLQANPRPDLIFMDIHLGDGQSFDIFEQVEITGCDYPLYHITEEGVRDWDELVYVKGETLDEYLTRTGLSAMDSYRCSFYSVLTGDGWASRGEMGWFGISDDNMEEREGHDQLQMFLKNAPDEAMLLSVDCHT